MRMMMAQVLVLNALIASAAPQAKDDPVAPGFPVWRGVEDKNHVCGRRRTPSDLRHKVTIFLEVDANDKLQEQLMQAGSLMARPVIELAQCDGNAEWEVPRTYATIISCYGMKNRSQVESALDVKKGDTAAAVKMRGYSRESGGCSIYTGVSYRGMVDTTGKRPYIHVFGPKGAEPVFHGTLTSDSLKEATAAVDKVAKEVRDAEPPWKPFFGTVAEPKFNTALKATLEKGKAAKKPSLEPIAKALLKDIQSKDEAKATEAQILFDAIAQTRSDLELKILIELRGSVHCAYRDMQTLLRYWPTEVKRVEPLLAALRAHPENELMGKIFIKLNGWSDPGFSCKNAAEAKKIIAELKKMKKDLAAPKESKNVTIQNCACLIDMKVDGMIASMEAVAK